jgi:hypothetical protein
MGGFFFFALAAAAQQPQKEINHQAQTWVSVNSTLHFTDNWGAIADFHIRRNNFVKDPSFYFIRFGANYWVRQKFTLAAGYAHMWQAPAQEDWTTFSNENRIYQQALMSTSAGSTSILFRFRNEQRWKQVIEADKKTGDWSFTNRVRYLMSFSIPFSKRPKKYAFVIADELLVNFGKQVVYNTFDQNRIFLGIRNRINGRWSYDIGYMNVYQQKANGYQYDMNHTFRWFFYYNPDFRKDKSSPRQVTDSREE